MEQKNLLLAVLIFYILGIIILASSPSVGKLSIVESHDKLLHLVEFFILAVILLKTLSLYKSKHPYLYTALFAAILVITSEAVQLFVPSRSFSLKDMMFDAMGIFIALISYFLM